MWVDRVAPTTRHGAEATPGRGPRTTTGNKQTPTRRAARPHTLRRLALLPPADRTDLVSPGPRTRLLGRAPVGVGSRPSPWPRQVRHGPLTLEELRRPKHPKQVRARRPIYPTLLVRMGAVNPQMVRAADRRLPLPGTP